MKNKMSKRGQAGVNALPAIVIALVVGFVTLSIGALVFSGVTESQYQLTATCNETGGVNTGCSAAYNASNVGNTALLSIADFGSTIGVIAAAGVLLALIGGLAAFVGMRR